MCKKYVKFQTKSEIPNKFWRGDLQAFLSYIWYALKDKITGYILIRGHEIKITGSKLTAGIQNVRPYNLNQADKLAISHL